MQIIEASSPPEAIQVPFTFPSFLVVLSNYCTAMAKINDKNNVGQEYLFLAHSFRRVTNIVTWPQGLGQDIMMSAGA